MSLRDVQVCWSGGGAQAVMFRDRAVLGILAPFLRLLLRVGVAHGQDNTASVAGAHDCASYRHLCLQIGSDLEYKPRALEDAFHTVSERLLSPIHCSIREWL